MAERIASKIKKQPGDGCWVWTARRNAGGYGTLGKGGPGTRNTLAHRASYEVEHGPIPEGMDVCHRCDTPPCVRPDHLFLGTARENIHDAIDKGRWRTPASAAASEARKRRGEYAKVLA